MKQSRDRHAAHIRSRLTSLILQTRLLRAIEGLSITALIILIPPLTALAAGLSGIPRTIILTLTATAALTTAIIKILIPLIRRQSMRDAALHIETIAPPLAGALASAVELITDDFARHYDQDMLDRLTASASDGLRATKSSVILPWRRPAVTLVITLSILTASHFTLTQTSHTHRDFVRYIMPPYLPAQESFHLESITGDIIVKTGATVAIDALCSGSFSANPTLITQQPGLDPVEIPMKHIPSRTSGILFRAYVPPVDGTLRYSVRYRRFTSKSYLITSVQPPAVSELRLKLTYPPYTGLPSDTKDGGGDLRIPLGTSVSFDISASSPLASASIIDAAGRILTPFSISKNRATGSFRFLRNTKYTIVLNDLHGFRNENPPQYNVEILPDAPPEARLIAPDRDFEAPRTAIVPIRGGASDDYGISSVRLVATILPSGRHFSRPIPISSGREVLFEYLLDLSTVNAFEGDTLQIAIAVSDNNAINGRKTVFSEKRNIKILSRFDDYRNMRLDQQDIVSRFEATIRDGENITGKFKQLASDVHQHSDGKSSFTPDTTQLLDRQQSLEKELSTISNDIRQSIEQMKNNDFVNIDTLAKMQELNSIMQDIMNDDIRKLLDQVKANLEKLSTGNVSSDMLKTMENQESIMRSLDQTLERLKKIRAEQDLNAVREHVRNLAGKQALLADQTMNLPKNKPGGPEAARLAREQNALRKDTENTLDMVRQLADNMDSFDEKAAADLKKAAADAEKSGLSDNMQNAERSLSSNSPRNSAPMQRSAEKSLRALGASLDGISDDHSKSMDDETKKLVRTLIRRTLDITAAHEKTAAATEALLSSQPETIPQTSIRRIIAEERAALETADFLARDTWRLAIISMAVPARVPALASEITSDLKKSISSASEKSIPNAVSWQRSATIKLNRLAILLYNARQDANSSGESELDKYMQELQKLASDQEALNQAASSMPMPGMSAMQQFAARQKAIGEGLKKLSSEMRNMSEMQERLNQIEDEMEEISRNLASGKYDAATQRRQSQVLNRLRDASLSLRKESLEQKRIAETGKDYKSAPPAAAKDLLKNSLPPELLRELDKARSEPRPPGYERLIEKYYNELLNNSK